MPDDGGGRFTQEFSRSVVLNIMLTGAHGFTGVHFMRHADAAGHTITPILSDLTDKSALENELRGLKPDAVVHLAAVSFVGHVDNAAFYAVNVVGTTNLLSALAQAHCKPKCVLVASSANVYGNCPQSPIDEDQAPAPVNHYAASKLAMEHMALTFVPQLPVVLARPFNYTGPGQALQFVIPKLIEHFKRRAPNVELGNIDVQREYNGVDFVCQSYLHLLEGGTVGATYNVCTGITYSLPQVVMALQKLTGHIMNVTINAKLVRANEVHRLCGNPARLMALWENRHAQWPDCIQLESTLAQMLDAS